MSNTYRPVQESIYEIVGKAYLLLPLVHGLAILFSLMGFAQAYTYKLVLGAQGGLEDIQASASFAALVFSGLGLLVFHVLRILGIAYYHLINRASSEQSLFLADVLVGGASVMNLWLVGVPYALWLAFGSPTPNQASWAAPVMLCFAGVSLLFVRLNWLYGFKRKAHAVKSRGENYPDSEQSAPDVARKELPTITFADIFGNVDIKRRLLDAGRVITGKRNGDKAARNGILMYGEPGNGKTVFAEALAGELKLPLFKLTHSDVASQWVGERTVRIKAAFDQAIRNQPCVLFIDEIDSFIPDRAAGSNQVKEDSDVVNALLTLLVDVRKHKVLVIAATNYMDRLDPAAVREGRFDFKVEITPPDLEARIGLLKHGLKSNVKTGRIDDALVNTVAERWNGFSVKRILAVTEELPSYLADKSGNAGRTEVTFDDFMAALRRIQGRKGTSTDGAMNLEQLVLQPETRGAMDMIAGRLRDPVRVERLGGTLPTGVLFSGPAGTGKTSACKSLAKAAGWAFLPTTGAELSRDPKALQKIHDQAKEMRPAIIFIDEADDLLRSREYSNNTESTNKLLTLMDGAGERVRDVLWVAATNHPDQIDSALLRGGRFTEKVAFELPSEKQLVAHIAAWLKKRGFKLGEGLDAAAIAAMIGIESIANVEAVLQYAVNRTISHSKDDAVVVHAQDIGTGVDVVLGKEH